MTGREAWSQWQSDAVWRPDATEAAPQPEPINAEARAFFEGHLRTGARPAPGQSSWIDANLAQDRAYNSYTGNQNQRTWQGTQANPAPAGLVTGPNRFGPEARAVVDNAARMDQADRAESSIQHYGTEQSQTRLFDRPPPALNNPLHTTVMSPYVPQDQVRHPPPALHGRQIPENMTPQQGPQFPLRLGTSFVDNYIQAQRLVVRQSPAAAKRTA